MKVPVNLNVKLVFLIDPHETGEAPSAFDVQGAALDALRDQVNAAMQNGEISAFMEESLEGPPVFMDYAEVTLAEDQP